MNEIIASVRAMFGTGCSEPSVVDLRQLVDEVLALAQGELATRKITLCNNMNTELPAVMAERVPIQQVVLNLVMNAIEAMSSVVGRERCLTIGSGFDQQASVTITIEDTGSGIDPVQLPRIFDPFFTTKSNGMGLGLSISRSIVEAHAGRLQAVPRSPFGTAFYLTLPIAGERAPDA